jgi:polar amino acid transport system substrate-binding protein
MRKSLLAAAALALVLAACAGEEPTVSSPSATGPSSPTAPATAAECASANASALKNPGVLTIGTSIPAFPPWFAGDTPTKPVKDPADIDAEGYEGATAYAIAEKMGFTADQVQWISAPWGQLFKPGPRDYDFALEQISYSPKRAQAVDFSDSYYVANQALVGLEGEPITKATSIADLKGYTLATQIGTTSLDYINQVIQPENEAGAYPELIDAITALKNGQVDGIVVDLPGAFYMTAVQISNGVIVGQFPPVEGTAGDQFGTVSEKGDPLVACVSMAIDELKADGSLKSFEDEWLSSTAGVPVFSTS